MFFKQCSHETNKRSVSAIRDYGLCKSMMNEIEMSVNVKLQRIVKYCKLSFAAVACCFAANTRFEYSAPHSQTRRKEIQRNTMQLRLLAFVVLAIVIRLLLVNSSYRNEISERVEISTPVNSWKRGLFFIPFTSLLMTKWLITGIEGIDLLTKGISPYSGDTFHETPIFLLFYSMLNELNEISINILYVMCDAATAVCLGLVCYVQLFDNSNKEITLFEKLKKEDKKELRIETENLKHLAISVTCIYLLCPYSILVCVAKTTSVFSNLLMSLLLLSISFRRRLFSCVLLALLTYQSLYPIMMLVPVVMAIEQSSPNRKCEEKYRFKSIFITIAMFTTSLTILLVTSYFVCNQSWRFLVTYNFL